MNEHEIRRAIAIVEKGIKKAYDEYADDIEHGYTALAANRLRGINDAEKEINRLRRALSDVTVSGDISVPTETINKVSIKPWWKRMFGF